MYSITASHQAGVVGRVFDLDSNKVHLRHASFTDTATDLLLCGRFYPSNLRKDRSGFSPVDERREYDISRWIGENRDAGETTGTAELFVARTMASAARCDHARREPSRRLYQNRSQGKGNPAISAENGRTVWKH